MFNYLLSIPNTQSIHFHLNVFFGFRGNEQIHPNVEQSLLILYM